MTPKRKIDSCYEAYPHDAPRSMEKRPMSSKTRTTAQVVKPQLAKLHLDECNEEPGENTSEEMAENSSKNISKLKPNKTKTTKDFQTKTKTTCPSQPEHNSVHPRGFLKPKIPPDPNE